MGIRLLWLLIIFVLTIISYFNVLDGEFQFDDDLFINDHNPKLKEPSRLFQGDLIKAIISNTRLVTKLTFAFNYAVGGLNRAGYHTGNLIIHLIVVFFVFVILKKILAMPSLQDSFNKKAELMALVIAGIFALHPLQTQAVSYIIQRAESLASFFYLLTFYLLIKFSESHGTRSFGYWILGITCFFLGWNSKEIIITIPLMFLIYTLFFGDRKGMRRAVIGTMPMLLVGIGLGINVIMGFKFKEDVGFAIKELGQPDYFFTEMRVLLTYLRLIFFPIQQNLDYDYPIYRDFWAIDVIVPMLLWILLTGMSLYTLKMHGKWKNHTRLMGFGILWFIILLLPTSSAIPVKDVINEHRAYLAMMGVVMTAVAGMDILLVKLQPCYGKKMWNIFAVTLVSIVILLSGMTYERNKVWRTKLALWEDALKKSPKKSRPNNNVGNCYYLQGSYESAFWYYKEAIKYDPQNVEAYYNAGAALDALGRRTEAVPYYIKFAEKAPEAYRSLVVKIEKELGIKRSGTE